MNREKKIEVINKCNWLGFKALSKLNLLSSSNI